MKMQLKRGKPLSCIALTVLAVALGPLAGCTATTSGQAVRASAETNDPIVALLDTGGYPTTAGPPSGAAGADNLAARKPKPIGWAST
jgi:hypothetical protein